MKLLVLDIPGYEDRYAACSEGYIISKERVSDQNHVLPERILKPTITSRGYQIVTLYKDGPRYFSVHRLIIKAFKGDSDLEVNHIDGNKLNNRLDNLEYVTRAENASHAKKLGLTKSWKGSKNPKAKLSKTTVSEIRKLYRGGGYTQKQLAAIYGIDQTSVSDIVLEKSWR